MIRELLALPGFGAIVGATLGLVTTVFVLFASNFIAEGAKRRSRRVEISIARVDEQIGKFYAPLSNLVEQLTTIASIKDQMVAQDPQHAVEIQTLAYNSYFLPIHLKIAEILEKHLHLLENRDIPESFTEYYKHVASERVLFSLFEEMRQAKLKGTLPENAAPINFSPHPFPDYPAPKPSFPRDIGDGFNLVLARQEALLASFGVSASAISLKNSN